MADPDVDKRLRYFTYQFLEEPDFTDEQKYHIDRRRRHNRYMHTPGVAGDGMVVTKAGPMLLDVSDGTAYDDLGREIVLTGTSIDLSVELTAPADNATVHISILYKQIESDPQTSAPASVIDPYTRWTEAPILLARTSTDPVTPNEVLLAIVTLQGGTLPTSDVNGTVYSTGRQSAGTAIGDGTITSAKLAPDVNQTISDSATHLSDTSNPHNTSAALVDTFGGTNQLVTQINSGTGIINKNNIDPTVSIASGWVRLPFLPLQYSIRPEFEHLTIHSISPATGAWGNMQIPIPPGVTRLTSFGISVAQNEGIITFVLVKTVFDDATGTFISTPPVLNETIDPLPVGTIFNTPYPVDASLGELDPEQEDSISLYIEASKVSDIWLVRAKFE